MMKRIYEIIEVADDTDTASKIYDIIMMCTIISSIIPLCFYEQSKSLIMIDKITVIIFIIDYALRLLAADAVKEQGIKSYLLYPFKPMAIIDLLAIIPTFIPINSAFKTLKILRLFRTFRIFKAARYSKNVHLILDVFKREKEQLLTVFVLSVVYIFATALIAFQVEPQTFGSFFKAIYWSTVSLTTVGYGDIYPLSNIGRFISMLSSFIGIAVVALPAGIIVAGYQASLENEKK